MTNLYITGYRSYELGIFRDKDPKINIIKKSLKREIIQFIENGTDWILTGGQSGVEQWTAEVCDELREEYTDLQLAIIFPFSDFGSNWKEERQLELEKIKQLADFVESTSHQPYKDPSQLKNYQTFLLTHSHAALLVYDPEFDSKTKFVYKAIQKKQQNSAYECRLIDFDQLQNIQFEE